MLASSGPVRLSPRVTPSLVAPVLFRLAFYRWRFRILDLDPMRRAPRAIERAEPFWHDALAAELAGVLENDVAITFVMLIEHNAELRPAHQLGQFPLAVLNR